MKQSFKITPPSEQPRHSIIQLEVGEIGILCTVPVNAHAVRPGQPIVRAGSQYALPATGQFVDGSNTNGYTFRRLHPNEVISFTREAD